MNNAKYPLTKPILMMTILAFLAVRPILSQVTDTTLTAKHTEAQIHQLEAQAEYYNTQNSVSHVLLTSVAGALGALFGSLITFWGLQVQARFQMRREQSIWERTKTEEEEKRKQDKIYAKQREVQMAAADLAKKVAMGINSMSWMLWIAKHSPSRFHQRYVDDHDKYMKTLYADIVSAQVSLAAVDDHLYSETLPLVRRLYALDGEIARCAINLPSSTSELGTLWAKAHAFEKDVPSAFSKALGERASVKPF